MKRIVNIFICALCALWAVAGPQSRWLSVTHDFGAFSEDDGPRTARFFLINDGDEPLAIISGRATCGCTTPKYPVRPIAPGDTAMIEVTYDPGGRPGRFSKYVYIETNTEPSRSRLEVKGVVIGSGATVARRFPVDMGPLKLAQRAMLLGEIKKGRLKTVYFDGYNRSADSLRVTITRKPEWLDITVTPSVAPPGEQVTLLAYVNSDRCPLYGLVEDSVSICPVAGGSEYTLPLTLIVKEDFSSLTQKQMDKAPVAVLSGTTIDLGEVLRRDGSVTATFDISNAGQSTLHLRRVYSSDPGVTVAAADMAVKKGRKVKVGVTADPSATPGAILNARVTVITDDPVNPVQTLRLTAILK